jgi:hypothetical protein
LDADRGEHWKPDHNMTKAKRQFDAVVWMRKRRTEIDAEDKGLSWEEKSRKTLDLLEKDSLWKRLKDRVVEPATRPKSGAAGR